MSSTNYPGIDYSPPGSTVNRDSETGIRYGVISQHAIDPDVANEIGQGPEWDDLGFKEAEEELKSKLRHALTDYYSDHNRGNGSPLDDAVNDALDALDSWAEGIETHGPWRMEQDGLVVLTDRGDSATMDLTVIKSPFYTYAQFCSPCAPGACHLENPLEVIIDDDGPFVSQDAGLGGNQQYVADNKCYCLPRDWFENDKAPYRMWRVDTNEEVLS